MLRTMLQRACCDWLARFSLRSSLLGYCSRLVPSDTARLDVAATWSDISDQVFFPGVRHGSAFEVPWEIYEKVAVFAGQ